jgi:hypothetical protein
VVLREGDVPLLEFGGERDDERPLEGRKNVCEALAGFALVGFRLVFDDSHLLM